jgi:hypothetical protein
MSPKRMTTFRRPVSLRGTAVETKVRPWHSVRVTDRKVFHDDSRCPEGAGIEVQYRREGTEGRRKCEQCQQFVSPSAGPSAR